MQTDTKTQTNELNENYNSKKYKNENLALLDKYN